MRTGWLAAGHGAAAGAALVVLALAVGCSSPVPAAGRSTPPASRPATSPAPASTPAQQPSPSAAEQAAEAVQGPAAVPTAAQLVDLQSQASEIAGMSPAQLAGQRVIYSFNGQSAPPGLLAAIQQGEVGGVIFFSPNIASPAQLGSLVTQLTDANVSQQNPARNYPLLLMTDQEGGLVRRLPWAGPGLSEAQIGGSGSPAA
ncbi:MAG: hypothetical protein ACRDOK_22050, partial [Streptosporangiaceae bacterium]